MAKGIAWLRPSKIKLVFLLEWSLFIVIEVARGKVRSGHAILVAACPLMFFYLVACELVVLSQRTRQITRGWRLPALAIELAVLDQGLKTVVTTVIPENASIPVIAGWLHIAHVRNYSGSWIAATFDLPGRPFVQLVQWALIIAVLVSAVVYHRYYSTHHRQSFWVDVAFLGVFAAYTSWVWDTVVRGYVIDFIQLPGLVTADLKDILVSVSAAAVIAEWLEHPRSTGQPSIFTNQEQK
ncbi:MAG: signal peptidase II [Anaerolineae bacterium]|nr:signal peptidase II [Anaerolineae bacterium]